MKLLRLTTDRDDGRFDNYLNEDLTIPVGGTIQLFNLTASIKTNTFTIDSSNQEVDVQTSQGEGFKSIILNNAIYTKNNYTDLLNDITFKFNRAVSYNPSDIGRQWKCSLEKGKVKCETRSKLLSPVPTSPSFYTVNTTYTKSSGIWERSNAGTGGTDSFLGFNIPQSLGSSSLRTRVYSMAPSTAPALSGFLIGYSTIPIISSTTGILLQNVAYAIQAPRKGGNYVCFRNGLEETANQVPIFDGDLTGARTDNDYVDIQLSGGLCRMRVYKANDVVANLNVFSYDHTTPLYPFIAFYGGGTNAGTRVSQTQWTPNPYVFTSTQFFDTEEQTVFDNLGITPPQIGVNIKSNGAINWKTIDLAEFLGFENVVISENQVENFNYIAGKLFNPADLVENFLVLLENIELESYDTLSNQRLNIVHSIVNPNIKTDKIEYNSAYPVKLQLKNKNPLTIRNIRARLVKEDLEAVNTIGFTSMTLLIE
jgi:hypothetical protein